METGKIQRITDRGFGFIEADSDEYSDDLFFHANELDGIDFDNLTEGEAVQFEVTETPKGMNAVNVSRADDDAGDDADAPEAPEAPEADEDDDLEA